MVRAQVVALALAACSKPAPATTAPDLAPYLYALSGTDARAAVDSWLLTGDEWDRVVVPPYRDVYEDYHREFETARATLVAQLATKHPIATRAHFAGDTTATHSQAMTRWALPTLAATRVAELAGRPPTPIDLVFVDVNGHWKAIAGIGAIVQRRVAQLDRACAAAIERIEPAGGPCIEAAWAVADAALRDDRPRFTHACGLAANLCHSP